MTPKKLALYTAEYLAKEDAKEEKVRKASETRAELEALRTEVKSLSERVSFLESRVDALEDQP